MNPPWILSYILIIWFGLQGQAAELDVHEEEDTNSTARIQREIIERERRLIPYMTFYLAHSVRNPNSGERQNILIPIQTQQGNVEPIRGVPQVQTNNIQNVAAQQYEVPITPPTPIRYNGFYPTPSIEITPKAQYKAQPEGVQVLSQVYGFKSPGPLVQQRPQLIRANVNLQPTVNHKYQEPQVIKIVPYNPNYNGGQYVVPTQNTRQTYTNNPYLSTNTHPYKERNVYVPGKVFAVNIVPQAQVHRFRPEKASQIFLQNTTPTPYRAKVKFELEDARVPVELNKYPTQGTYVPEQISSNYIGEQPVTEAPKKEQQVYYDVSKNGPGHFTFIPIRAPSPSIAPVQVAAIQSPPQQIQIVEDVTPRPHDASDINHASQIEKEEDKSSLDTSVVNLLTILKQTNQLPQNFTPENIDNSIKTLALLLERLQNEKKYQTYAFSKKSKPKPTPAVITEENTNKLNSYPQESGTSTPGRPGIDYPTYSTIPQTQFDCSTQRYKGFFGDPETNCQVWHYCDLNGGQASFLCPNGTIFSQVALTCDWWFNVKCSSTSQLYVLNERLYKYILPFSPSFPEDYSGPLVDRYLAAKFKEMEAKARLKALKALISTAKPDTSSSTVTTDVPDTTTAYGPEIE